MADFINFEIQFNTGIIHLNRPKTLNALNLEMAELFLNKLNEWQSNKLVKRVLLTGEGNAFCSGGDIKSLFFSSGKSNLKELFLRTEYTLNYTISKFTKPYLSIWNGLVMGGGVGLSIYGNARLATEKTKFAMPETAIGFFPDAGSSYFLSRIKNGIGLYLGLTGHVLNTYEILNLGLSTHYQTSNKLNLIKQKYIQNGILPKNTITTSETSEIIENKDFIKKTFTGDLFFIMQKLKNSSLLFAKKIHKKLLLRCPMSLAVTFQLIKRAEKKSLKDCLEMEFQLSQYIVYRNDFNEGINNVLISRASNPKWKPSSIYDINFKEVESYFKPHVKPLNL